MTLKKCSHCNKNIFLNNKYILYRCCDADVCSYKCSVNRFKNIQNYDPELNCPTNWHNFNITNSSNINFNNNINKSMILIKRSQSLDNLLKTKLPLETIFENNSLYNIPEYNEVAKKKSLNTIYKFITIRLIALSLIIYKISNFIRVII